MTAASGLGAGLLVLGATCSVLGSAAPVAAAASPVQRPTIAWDPIPFPASRKAQTAAYAERHYGIRRHLLRRPRVIVEHVAVAPTVAAIKTAFSGPGPDRELGERPQVCAHFVVDRDGSIRQLVSLRLICRHAIGLNHVAIGIEHVGFADRELMYNRAQLSASLRLTTWLRCRFEIGVANVIGHAESQRSPRYRERVAGLRGRTHSDMSRATMAVYRSELSRRRCR